jgi:hypothetical protein
MPVPSPPGPQELPAPLPTLLDFPIPAILAIASSPPPGYKTFLLKTKGKVPFDKAVISLS